MKKTMIALSLVLGSTAAVAMPSSNLDINVAPVDGGAWVKLTQNNMPVAGASINNGYVTNADGRVFVHVSSEPATSAEFVAVAPDGESVSKFAFIPRQ